MIGDGPATLWPAEQLIETWEAERAARYRAAFAERFGRPPAVTHAGSVVNELVAAGEPRGRSVVVWRARCGCGWVSPTFWRDGAERGALLDLADHQAAGR